MFSFSLSMWMRNICNIGADLLDIIFFIVMLLLFPLAAEAYHNSAYRDYKKTFAFQAFGSAMSLAINLIINVILLEQESDNPLVSPTYLELMILQMLGLYVFVLSKEPVDLFSTFCKRPDIQFSVFQYPRFCNAEKKIKLIKNTAIIEKALAD